MGHIGPRISENHKNHSSNLFWAHAWFSFPAGDQSFLLVFPTGINRKTRPPVGNTGFPTIPTGLRPAPSPSPQGPKAAPFLRDHLFVTKRVAVRDGNFLIGAPFVSDRPRHLFFRPNKSVLGPVDVFVPFLSFHDIFFIVSRCCFVGERPNSWGNKKNNLHRPRVGGALALWAQRQPIGGTTKLGGNCKPYGGPYRAL